MYNKGAILISLVLDSFQHSLFILRRMNLDYYSHSMSKLGHGELLSFVLNLSRLSRLSHNNTFFPSQFFNRTLKWSQGEITKVVFYFGAKEVNQISWENIESFFNRIFSTETNSPPILSHLGTIWVTQTLVLKLDDRYCPLPWTHWDCFRSLGQGLAFVLKKQDDRIWQIITE